jgi:hypothetical protein
VPALKDDGQGRKAPAKLRPGHKLTPLKKDAQGRYFCTCSCEATLLASTPNKLSDAVMEHLVDRGTDAEPG